ncbi:MAG: hypothetical protein ABWW66_06610 [Archaeoglobaceae archaeon]
MFAVLALGLEKLAERISEEFEADVFFSPEDIDYSCYDFVLVTAELTDERVLDLRVAGCRLVMFLVTSVESFESMMVSRAHAEKVLREFGNFEGAILSGYLSDEEKLFALRELLNSLL